MRLLSSAATGAAVVSSLLAGSFLNPVVTGGTTATAGSDYLAAAAAFALIGLFFGVVRLGMMDGTLVSHGLDAVPTRVKVTARHMGIFAAVTLVVTTAATSGYVPNASPVGTASADYGLDPANCGPNDLIFYAVGSLTGSDEYDACLYTFNPDAVQNMTQTDAYAQALGIKDNKDSYVTTTNNFMQDTRTVAYSKGKMQLVNELNNGSSVSQAKLSVNQTVEDYYSRQQKEIITDWNAKATQIDYIDNITAVEVHSYTTFYNNAGTGVSTITEQFTLINGSQVNVTVLAGPNGWFHSPVGFGSYYKAAKFHVNDPDSSDQVVALRTSEYGHVGSYGHGNPGNENLLNQVQTQSEQVKANLAPYVDEVYSQHAAGEISSIDLVANDPSVIGSEAATSFNSTGHYSQAAIMLASLGAAGNINASHTIVTGDNTTLNGTLYYTLDDTPSGGWATGTTYNISDFNGTFYMAVQKDDGNGTIVDLSNYGDNFTITEAIDTQTGETVNATQVQTYTYDSTNASALADELDRLKELRQEYEAQLDALTGGGTVSDGDGGGGGIDLKTEDKAIIALAAVALILVMRG